MTKSVSFNFFKTSQRVDRLKSLASPNRFVTLISKSGIRKTFQKTAAQVTKCQSQVQPEGSSGSSSNRSSTVSQALRNLVIAVDASEDSIAAFEWALVNLYRNGDAMHILHVVQESKRSYASSGSIYYPQHDPLQTNQALWNQAEQFIKEEFVTVAVERGIEVHMVLVRAASDGHVGRAVCQKAEELDASPLVLYSHNKGKLEEILWGSVSKYVALNCRTPVVLVHSDSP